MSSFKNRSDKEEEEPPHLSEHVPPKKKRKHVSALVDSSEKVKSFVGDSRGAIFKDKSLALLMIFFKLVQKHLASTTKIDESIVRISEEDMEIPFVDFLTKMRSSCMPLRCKIMIKTIQKLVEIYLRPKRGLIDWLYIHYIYWQIIRNSMFKLTGGVDISNLWTRRTSTSFLSLSRCQRMHLYKAIELIVVTKYMFKCQKLILDPYITVGLESLSSLTDQQKETLRVLVPKAISSKGKITRGICIIRGYVKADTLSVLIVYPPKSLFPEQLTTFRILQLGSGLANGENHAYMKIRLRAEDVQGRNVLTQQTATP
ncbi:unnamed protein product [Arabis nemorensis]|uniref:Uncharacterized protein n=1 Tax=Arabis nemorensis TaxID=586526 RepID=A0A565C972_9BRAS|nr:unnamed protein product [Arabis nemorensis]